jgi:AAA family ATP:ADP antiporter
MLGGSLGSILAGPLISLCTSKHWAQSFNLMILLIVLIGAIAGALYYTLGKRLTTPINTLSLKTSIATCWQQPSLRYLSWLVIADYVAYSLSEVIFLHVLHLRFPAATDYCRYMGTLTSWQGALTLISSLSFAPWILKRHPWVVAALITPLSLLATGSLFFLSLSWTETAVLFGSIQYCLCRAAKSTLFDPSKELAFVSLPPFQRMQGKLIVDGLSARIGRGAASLLSIGLIQLSGGVMASALLTGVLSTAMTLSWTHITWKLGSLLRRSELPKS